MQATSKASDQIAQVDLAHTTLLEISCRGSFDRNRFTKWIKLPS